MTRVILVQGQSPRGLGAGEPVATCMARQVVGKTEGRHRRRNDVPGNPEMQPELEAGGFVGVRAG